MEPQRISIGRRIRELREAAGLTQSKLAGKLKVRQGTLSGWERGSVDHRLESLLAVAKVLKVSLDDLRDMRNVCRRGEPP